MKLYQALRTDCRPAPPKPLFKLAHHCASCRCRVKLERNLEDSREGELVMKCLRRWGFAADDFFGKRPPRRLMAIRHAVAYVLYEDYKLSNQEIGKILERDHSTITNSRQLIAADPNTYDLIVGQVRAVMADELLFAATR